MNKYLKFELLKEYTFEDVGDILGLFDNPKDYYEILRKRNFKALKITLNDVLRNVELLEFIRSKYSGITNADIVRLTEMLFVSGKEELDNMDFNDMFNNRKEFDYVMDKIWIPFIESLGIYSKLYFYTWDSSNILEIIENNNLNHMVKSVTENLFLLEYSDILLVDEYNDLEKIKLIELIDFDKYIVGFSKDYNILNGNIEYYKNNNIVILLYINHELGNGILIVDEAMLSKLNILE